MGIFPKETSFPELVLTLRLFSRDVILCLCNLHEINVFDVINKSYSTYNVAEF